MIKINIQTTNAAFGDGDELIYGQEVSRILRKLADQFENMEYPENARDINGNKVVKIEYIPE